MHRALVQANSPMELWFGCTCRMTHSIEVNQEIFTWTEAPSGFTPRMKGGIE